MFSSPINLLAEEQKKYSINEWFTTKVPKLIDTSLPKNVTIFPSADEYLFVVDVAERRYSLILNRAENRFNCAAFSRLHKLSSRHYLIDRSMMDDLNRYVNRSELRSKLEEEFPPSKYELAKEYKDILAELEHERQSPIEAKSTDKHHYLSKTGNKLPRPHATNTKTSHSKSTISQKKTAQEVSLKGQTKVTTSHSKSTISQKKTAQEVSLKGQTKVTTSHSKSTVSKKTAQEVSLKGQTKVKTSKIVSPVLHQPDLTSSTTKEPLYQKPITSTYRVQPTNALSATQRELEHPQNKKAPAPTKNQSVVHQPYPMSQHSEIQGSCNLSSKVAYRQASFHQHNEKLESERTPLLQHTHLQSHCTRTYITTEEILEELEAWATRWKDRKRIEALKDQIVKKCKLISEKKQLKKTAP